MATSNFTEIQSEYFANKADTLEKLSTLLKKSYIEELLSFTEKEWRASKQKIIDKIQRKFSGDTVVVRSSALGEDNIASSGAGVFRSEKDIDSNDPQAISVAIDGVISSYHDKNMGNANNKVLVQKQTLNVLSSGVVLTRNYFGSPYYVINYLHGEDTAAVTSGNHTTSLRVLRSGSHTSGHTKKILEAVREIESVVPTDLPLDIEYGLTQKDHVVTFQVRPLLIKNTPDKFSDAAVFETIESLKRQFGSLSRRRSHMAGHTTYFGDMPDWNPAEIIGASPRPLAASLYHEVITGEIWHQARSSQGYTDVDPAKLVVLFGNKPYVDIRCSFNSLIPAKISPPLKEKLLRFYLGKLRKHPELQDKVEFEILFTCYDLSFNRRSSELAEAGFTPSEIDELGTNLLQLTNHLLDTSSILDDLKSNEELDKARREIMKKADDATPSGKLVKALQLLEICKELGTLQFSRLARQAFIGKRLLTSLVEEKHITDSDYHAFLASINTVATDFTRDITSYSAGKLSKAAFFDKYGHLRPGTYNIEINRYDSDADYLSWHGPLSEVDKQAKGFALSSAAHTKVSKALNESGIKFNSKELFQFVQSALEAREYSKLLFTRCISDAIELISSAGEALGFSRSELSFLDVPSIRRGINQPKRHTIRDWSDTIQRNKDVYNFNKLLVLPPIIFSKRDFEIVSDYSNQPNYITDKQISGDLVFLNNESSQDITGKIVALESADPGYDWIFTKNPLGLVTKYGGPASHMAIRCAEFELPAIIGAGDQLFASISQSRRITINCESKKTEMLGEQ